MTSAMNRRAFVAGLGAVLTAPLAAGAQPAGKVWRIGILEAGKDPNRPIFMPFRTRLADRGWTIQFESRFADGQPERLPALAAELVRLNVDVLLTLGTFATKAAKDATTTIPIVFVGVSSPIRAGVVASLARPGGNVTGATDQLGDLGGKLLQIITEIAPKASRIGHLTDLSNPSLSAGSRENFDRIAQQRGLRVIWADVRRPEDLDPAFVTLSRERAEALMVANSPALVRQRYVVAKLALQNRLPAITNQLNMVEAGLLTSYHPDWSALLLQAADYVDRIFKGAKPADLPVVQPTKFELVINLKTAKALGLTIPQSLLLRADQIIE